MRKLILLAGLAVVPHLMGQATMGQTTFAQAVNATTSTVQLASVTGVQAGVTILFADREAMNVISLVGFQATVQRGSGGQAGTHTTTATVWVGPPNYYGQFDPAGACVRNQIPALPRVIIPTGNVFECTAGAWVQVTGVAGVSAFNGRTGAVTPTTGDYTAAEVTNAARRDAANTFATGLQDFSAASFKPSLKTVATLPSAATSTNLIFLVTDGQSASDCTMGGGTTQAQCASNGSAWVALGGGSIAPCTISTTLTCPGFIASDATKSGGILLPGLTSGAAAWVVADVAGTSVGYIMPTTNPSTRQFLADNGSTTCPTLAITVTTCRQLVWKGGDLLVGTTINLVAGISQLGVCTASCTVNVPLPAEGAQYCVYNDDNTTGVITFAALGGGAMYETTARTSYGTAGTGTMVSGGAVADRICIVFRDATHYSTLGFNGTITVN